MRSRIFLLLAMVAFADVAAADPPQRVVPKSQWKSAPTAADYERVLSPEAKASKDNQLVDLWCNAAEDGSLFGCKIASGEPGFGQSALELARLIRVGPPAEGGPVVGPVIIPIYFQMNATGPSVIQNPDWLVLPTADEVKSWANLTAAEKRGHGYAVAKCTVNVAGRLENCVVGAEYPIGQGYGAAALRITPHLRMKPQLRSGEPVSGARMMIPFKF